MGRPSSMWLVPGAVVVGLAMGGGSWVAASGGGSEPAAAVDQEVDISPYFACNDPEPRPDPPEITDEMTRDRQAFLDAVLAFEAETGWGRVSGPHVSSGQTTCGWTPAMGTTYEDIKAVALEAQMSSHGYALTPVYDDIEGSLIGHLYGPAGFVPIEMSTDPDIDVAALID